MQIQIKGHLTIQDLRQAIFEKLIEAENDLAIAFSQGATLYINPTNREGDPVVPHNRHGTEISKLLSNGPYRAAADQYKI